MASGASRRRWRPHLRSRSVQKCESWKRGYATRPDALDAAERTMAAGQVQPGCHLMPYECPRCGEWHVANRRIVF